MKFKIQKANFVNWLQLARDVFVKTHILIKVNENNIEVSGMRLDGVCYIENSFKITNITNETGSFCVSYDDFIKRVKILDKEFTVIISSRIRMKSDNKLIEMDLIPENEVKPMPKVKYEEVIHMKASNLLKAIEKTREFASKDELRPVLQSIKFKFSEDSVLTTVATDSVQLAEFKTNIEGCYDKEFMLMASGLKGLKYLFNKESEIDLLLGENAVYFAHEDLVYMIRTINGKFPAYQGIFPEGIKTQIKCNRIQLLNAVSNSSISCNISTYRVVINTNNEGLNVVGSRNGGNNKISQTIPCESDNNNDMSIGFDFRRLENIVKHCELDNIVIDVLDPLKPVTITEDSNYRMLIMPIR